MLKPPKPGKFRTWLLVIFLIILILGWSILYFWIP